jgi:hypothetical protein
MRDNEMVGWQAVLLPEKDFVISPLFLFFLLPSSTHITHHSHTLWSVALLVLVAMDSFRAGDDRPTDETIETETRITSLLIRIGDKSSSTSSLESNLVRLAIALEGDIERYQTQITNILLEWYKWHRTLTLTITISLSQSLSLSLSL